MEALGNLPTEAADLAGVGSLVLSFLDAEQGFADHFLDFADDFDGFGVAHAGKGVGDLEPWELAEAHVDLVPEFAEVDLVMLVADQFMVIFEVKGIEAYGEEAQNNECQSFIL